MHSPGTLQGPYNMLQGQQPQQLLSASGQPHTLPSEDENTDAEKTLCLGLDVYWGKEPWGHHHCLGMEQWNPKALQRPQQLQELRPCCSHTSMVGQATSHTVASLLLPPLGKGSQDCILFTLRNHFLSIHFLPHMGRRTPPVGRNTDGGQVLRGQSHLSGVSMDILPTLLTPQFLTSEKLAYYSYDNHRRQSTKSLSKHRRSEHILATITIVIIVLPCIVLFLTFF